jgi:hypothetical protein
MTTVSVRTSRGANYRLNQRRQSQERRRRSVRPSSCAQIAWADSYVNTTWPRDLNGFGTHTFGDVLSGSAADEVRPMW